MNKKEKSEVASPEKKSKRIKSLHSRPHILSIVPVNVDCFQLEEHEKTENCYGKFLETCDKMQDYFQNMCNAKRGKENEAVATQFKSHVCMLTMRLKKLNRIDKHHWKKSRDAVNERKQKVDALHLQYQNLLYEVTHLQKEVTKCLEFKSLDEDIELVTVEEFYRDAPESISRPEITKHDPHELRLARLFWESEQRKRFAQKLKEAEVIKLKYIQEQRVLQGNLSNVLPILKSIIEAAEPFQSKMGMPFEVIRVPHKLAKYLCKPLYVLYVQACAYKEYCLGKNMEINVEGNIDEIKTLQTKAEDMSEESGESDREESSEVVVHRQTESNKKIETKKDVLMKHPMTVIISIEKESKIVLEFRYLVHLHIITVVIKSVSPEPMSTELVGDLLRTDTFLNSLFPEDTGQDSPNLASIYVLKSKFGYEDSPFSNVTTGWPFLWAQKICGLDFLSPIPGEIFDSKNLYKKIPSSMEKTINAICSRLESRNQLYHQMITLEQKINVPPNFAALYPSNVSSQLKKWYPVPWKEILNDPNAEELQNLDIINKDTLIYKAVLQRGSAVLSVLGTISPEYPVKTPVLVLHLSWKGSHTTRSNFALRELEEEINVNFMETLSPEFKENLLLCQLYHLAVCFDVFLETEYSGDSFEGPHEFMREKVVVRYARGSSRSRPYKCVSNQGIFTYR
ncbi:THO complex subunit 5 homolog [Trichonephila clavata]|uniref:THO complex subunit 5 homolog n=1 Tax=Trichonephila clavata TaxID=2740835 RepID=A0A8X6LRE8_TRICU|nr:THO complex subunit 5 homolog [Trichonephila clavata]